MISFNEPIIGIEEKRLLHEAIDKSSIAQGPYVRRFEQVFSSYCGTSRASACFNGTAALHLALSALNIKNGDEVIVPSFTFVGTANAVSYTNAKPVFADIKKDTLCIDPSSIRNKITKKTKAIIPVHIYGNPCDMKQINEIANKHGVHVVEDAAEAHGAVYKGKKVGSLSDIGCFSFHFSKIVKTGEGGMCLTNDEELDEKIKLLRSQGKVKNEELKGDDFIERGYYHQMLGFNYRMTDLQAAIGIAQMRKIDDNIKSRRRIAAVYDEEFRKYDVGTIEKEKDSSPVYWTYPLLFKSREIKLQVGRELVKRGVPFASFFWPCHKQPFYSSKERLPVTEDISLKGLAIPCNAEITEEDAKKLTKIVGKIVKNA